MRVLNHRNVIKVYDIFNGMNEILLVLELIDSGDLLSFIRRERRLPERQAAQVMHGLLEALRYLRQAGLIHRDIKPENVILKFDRNGDIADVKIIDFGFAVYESELAKLPPAQRRVGTVNYIAPEVLLDQEYDCAVDMFAAGVILFFMVSGELPFDHILEEEIAANIKACQP